MRTWILAIGSVVMVLVPAGYARDPLCYPGREIHIVEGATVTSYWTVRESFYAEPGVPVASVPVIVDEETGEVIYYTCHVPFLEEVKTEGWGETLGGEYIGWWDGAFHLGPAPLDAQGNELVPYMTVAVDPELIPPGAWVAVIPNRRLPTKLLCRAFRATDTGVEGAWPDVYVGFQYTPDMNDTPDAYYLTGVRLAWSPSLRSLMAFLRRCWGCGSASAAGEG